MNKIIFASFLAMLGLVSFSHSGTRFDAWQFIEAPATSGTVITGKCTLGAIYSSSNSASTLTSYFFVADTSGANSLLDTTMFSNADYRSPVILFPVSTVTTSGYDPFYLAVDYGSDGIAISSSPYVYKSAATSGFANRVWLKIKQN